MAAHVRNEAFMHQQSVRSAAHESWLFGGFLMNIIGGRSSRYQLAGNLDQVSLLASAKGSHPGLCRLRVIDSIPFVSRSYEVALVIAVQQAMVVLSTVFQKEP